MDATLLKKLKLSPNPSTNQCPAACHIQLSYQSLFLKICQSVFSVIVIELLSIVNMIYLANDLYKTAYREEMNYTAKVHGTRLRRFHGLSFWDALVICSRRIYKTSDTRSEVAADSLWNCFPGPEWKSRRGSIAFRPRSR